MNLASLSPDYQFLGDHATNCKMVRPMLSDHCPVCLSCPICDVGVLWPNGWIKMKLGTEIGLGTGHNALDGDPAPHHGKGHSSPPFFGPLCSGEVTHLSNG